MCDWILVCSEAYLSHNEIQSNNNVKKDQGKESLIMC